MDLTDPDLVAHDQTGHFQGGLHIMLRPGTMMYYVCGHVESCLDVGDVGEKKHKPTGWS